MLLPKNVYLYNPIESIRGVIFHWKIYRKNHPTKNTPWFPVSSLWTKGRKAQNGADLGSNPWGENSSPQWGFGWNLNLWFHVVGGFFPKIYSKVLLGFLGHLESVQVEIFGFLVGVFFQKCSSCWFFPTQLKNMLSSKWVRIFPKVRGEHTRYMKPPPIVFYSQIGHLPHIFVVKIKHICNHHLGFLKVFGKKTEHTPAECWFNGDLQWWILFLCPYEFQDGTYSLWNNGAL